MIPLPHAPLLAALLPLLCAVSCSKSGVEPRRPPRHLLLISIDTLRADHLACYGGRDGISPNVDRIAAEGARIETTFAPMGMTLACVTSLLTSRYPDEHSVTYNQAMAPESEFTLAERLAKRGFRNRALVANGVLSAKFSGLAQGYKNPETDYLRIDDEEELTRRAEQLLAQGFGGEQQEFLWLHYMAPHAPYTPPLATVAQLSPDYDGPYDGTGTSIDPVFVEKRSLDPVDIEQIRALYDGEIATVDAWVGRVLAALERSGQADETLVVLTADHGEELYDRNCYFYHANSLYGSVTHIPLLFRLPGRIAPGTTVPGITELLDVMPTLLDYLDVPPNDDRTSPVMQGTSLRRAIDGARVEKEITFSQVVNEVYAARNRRWLYVRNPNHYVPKSVPEAGVYEIAERELYNLERDPGEQHNVADQHPDVVAEMERRLDAWAYQLRRIRPKTRPNLPPERLEELKQLGYLDPGFEDGPSETRSHSTEADDAEKPDDS